MPRTLLLRLAFLASLVLVSTASVALPQITIQSVTSPQYSSAGNATIDVTVTCTPFGQIPMTLAPNDQTTYAMAAGGQETNAQIYNLALAGAYGPIAPYVAPTPSVAQIAAAALSAGLTITSTSTPALNGIYSVDAQAQANITSVMTGVAAGVGLPGGGASFNWLDRSGAHHTFTQVQFLNLSKAIMNYVYNLQMYGYGQSSQPAATATIP